MTAQKLTQKQLKAVEIFQTEWGKFLIALGGAFMGNNAKNLMVHGQNIANEVMQKYFDLLKKECRGTMDLNRLVMFVGQLCGDQLGQFMVDKGIPPDSDVIHQGASMFEAAFRVACEKHLSGTGEGPQKSKLILPRGGILA